MIEVVKNLTKEQLDFIVNEFGIGFKPLLALNEDELYDKVYDPCCVIEEIETVQTLDDNSNISDRGQTASELVTLLGNTI